MLSMAPSSPSLVAKDGRRNFRDSFCVSIAGQEVGVTVCPVRDHQNAVTGNWFLAGHSFLSQPEMEAARPPR